MWGRVWAFLILYLEVDKLLGFIGRTLTQRKILIYVFTHLEQSFHIRDIAGTISKDPGNVSRELNRLEKEGLFDQARKRPIPLLPQKIGVITSPTGAAIRDILNVINRRFANVEILLYPVQVQGNNAKFQIAEAIEKINDNFPEIDVIISGRGGGSLEDLWAYNEEIVARAIFASRIPIISAVGHEIDFTISDFVADLRAPTPSAAAELVVKNKEELKKNIQSLSSFLEKSLWMLYKNAEHRLRIILEKKVMKHPELTYLPFFQKLEYIEEKLQLRIKELLGDCASPGKVRGIARIVNIQLVI